MNDFTQVITNYAATLPSGFQPSPTWPYVTPAMHYFWAGFILMSVVLLFSWGLRIVQRIIGAGVSDL